MLLLAASIIAAAAQERGRIHAGASAQAIATVRIISGAVLHFGDDHRHGEAQLARETVAHIDGAVRAAKLIEFE
jgi:hypothetical protein